MTQVSSHATSYCQIDSLLTSTSLLLHRLLLGDSRWVPGQLDAEIASGCWMLCKVDSSTLDLFSGRCVPKAGATLLELQSAEWARVLSSLGPQYAELAKVPTDAWEQLQQLKT